MSMYSQYWKENEKKKKKLVPTTTLLKRVQEKTIFKGMPDSIQIL
jgi:hypothetical protein